MPSDPRTLAALAALAQPIAEFRAMVQGALTQADAFIAALHETAEDAAIAARAELGDFAARRMDAAAFAALFPRARLVDPVALATLRRAADVLRSVRFRGDDLFVLDVPSGARLGVEVSEALAGVGRAFGAVMLSEVVRGGRFDAARHGGLLEPVEFLAWNKNERRIAPPLVIEVDGSDVHAGALADFADGHEKLVLVIRGACGPAPLARSITPGTFVLQTVDGSGLDRLASFDGPAIAAIVPAGAAEFLHDPSDGRESWQRLTVSNLPEPPKRAIGGLSAFQMGEDLRMLGDLARTPFSVPVASGAAVAAVGASDAVEKIASWLMGEAGLGGQA
jgi:hypothetical protein